MSEYFPGKNSEEQFEKERQRISIIEDSIGLSHESGLAVKGGVGFSELFGIPADMLIFIEKGEDVLNLTGKEAERFNALCMSFINNELNDERRKGDLSQMAIWKARFDEIERKRVGREEKTT